LVIAASVLLVVGLGVSYAGANVELTRQTAENQVLQQKVKQLQSTQKMLAANQATKKDIEKREQDVKQLQAQGLIMSNMLKEIQKALPTSVVITSMQVGAGSLNIGGQCPNNQELATFVAGLRASKMFTAVQTLSSQSQGGIQAVTFSIQVDWGSKKS
jgi:Tfp pilus assembly protein PilN